jgi:hypothetical protein
MNTYWLSHEVNIILIILLNNPKVDAVQAVVHYHLPFKCPAF